MSSPLRTATTKMYGIHVFVAKINLKEQLGSINLELKTIKCQQKYR